MKYFGFSVSRAVGQFNCLCQTTSSYSCCYVMVADERTESHRDETKKLKAYIVKMKKELAETRDKMATDSASSETERAELQRQLDALREAVGAGQQRSEFNLLVSFS